MPRSPKEDHPIFLFFVGLLGWFLPGAGYLLLNQKKRAIIIFAAITLIFCLGIYVGSIGVVDPVKARLWYLAQVMTSPLVVILGYYTAGGGFPVYGRPSEVGQIYTAIAGLLNLLVIINTVYLAHVDQTGQHGD